MTVRNKFQDRYLREDTPWEIGKPDFNLVRFVKEGCIERCKALEIGCGTGANALWLADQGFDVVAIDFAQKAIEKAKKKCGSRRNCAFYTMEFSSEYIPGSPFGFVFDRGCFHTIDNSRRRKKFVQNVSLFLNGDGVWLSLVGSADEEREGRGPPGRSAADIV
ncbi:MAG: class I SAM-dependent methyltransferase, partial [Planctomycetota bacterium]